MIKQIDYSVATSDDWPKQYSYEFSTKWPLDTDYTDIHAEIIIDDLIRKFETELRLKLGYELEQKWVKK